MQKITPFFWFDKSAEEAMNFYVSLFAGNSAKKGESKIVSIKRYPSDMQVGPVPDMAGKVLTGVFMLDGQEFMALDGGPLFSPNESTSFLIDCGTQEEIDYFWNGFIAAGGMESQCGWLKDKWGFSWQITPDMEMYLDGPDAAGSARALQAMLSMKKLVIADLKRAYEGA